MREGESTVVNDGGLPPLFYNMAAMVQSQLFNYLKLPLNPSHNQGTTKSISTPSGAPPFSIPRHF